MDISLGTYGLALAAGTLSTLSPCVLPLIPILLGAASQAHARAPLALAAGLALSYAVLGSLLAWAGAAWGLDSSMFRDAGAVLLGGFGLVLLSSHLQTRLSAALAGVGNLGHTLMEGVTLNGLGGQFVIGLLLGAVWSPCVGPTLGAAVVLASQGQHIARVASVMAVFGMGAALPLAVLSTLSRATADRWRGRLLAAGAGGKKILGVALLAVAVLILSGADRSVEAWLVEHSPQWLTQLTTRY